jgi:hypothetical protein
LTGFFAALWLISAWLFRKAARGGPNGVRYNAPLHADETLYRLASGEAQAAEAALTTIPKARLSGGAFLYTHRMKRLLLSLLGGFGIPLLYSVVRGIVGQVVELSGKKLLSGNAPHPVYPVYTRDTSFALASNPHRT